MAAQQDPVRFGIIGLGVGKSRVKQAATTAGARLVAVCDLQEELATAQAAEYGCDWHTDHRALLERQDIDAVGIFTPSGTHGDLAIESLQAGKHTFTTKPMDVSTAKIDQVIGAGEASGKILAVDFQRRYEPGTRLIKQALDAGRIGRPIFGDFRLKWYRADSYFAGGNPPGWRGTWQYDGGGSAANQGIHGIDQTLWFMGPVARVRARINVFNHDIETEDACEALVTYASGAWGVIQTTTTVYGGLGHEHEIHGTDGTIQMRQEDITTWAFADDPDGGMPDPAELAPGPANIVEDMLGAIRDGKPVACSGPEGRRSVELLEAMYTSAREDREVTL